MLNERTARGYGKQGAGSLPNIGIGPLITQR
jgi:hypothetical protein